MIEYIPADICETALQLEVVASFEELCNAAFRVFVSLKGLCLGLTSCPAFDISVSNFSRRIFARSSNRF